MGPMFGLVGKSLGAAYLTVEIITRLEAYEDYILFIGVLLLLGRRIYCYVYPTSSFINCHLTLQALTGKVIVETFSCTSYFCTLFTSHPLLLLV